MDRCVVYIEYQLDQLASRQYIYITYVHWNRPPIFTLSTSLKSTFYPLISLTTNPSSWLLPLFLLLFLLLLVLPMKKASFFFFFCMKIQNISMFSFINESNQKILIKKLDFDLQNLHKELLKLLISYHYYR